MEIQLEDLISRIQTEGVKEAERRAQDILSAAQKQAADLVAEAQKKAQALIDQAERRASEFEMRSREALKQASRDLLLNLRQRICAQFEALLKEGLKESLKGPVLEELLKKMLDNWLKNEKALQLEVLLDPADKERLSQWSANQFAKAVASGVEFKPVANIEAGFRLGLKDGSAYYDFSAQALASLLSAFVNERISHILKEASGELK